MAEPVEYVRVCDAYGSGYFYIPGTETCLFLQGRTGVSVLENPSDLGVGVVRRQIGLNFSETFGSAQANYLWRYGGGFSVRRELGEFEQFERFNVVPTGYVYFDFDFALGSSGENGWVQSGGDVQGLGFTFLYPDMGLGNGVIAVGPGWSLQSHTDTDYSWGLGSAGFGKTYPIDLGGSGGGLTFSAGPYVETLQYDSDGRGEIFFNNAPINLDQTYRYDSSDWWGGVRGDMKVNWHPSHKWFFSTGVYATAGYHRGEASIRQITNTPLPPPNDIVDQWLNYSGSDFSVGGGANFSAGYVLNENSQIGFNAEVSVLPDVTAFRIPENPGEIPGVFYKEDVFRYFFNITYQRQFPVE